ncbi:hypothetical protein EXIGLDRAFT_726105 [Exidia glandulosa HHB12029]|uniref:Uncharacterized protein n=1 Tax=Exidia glandulosa HHB12029 TaxID=1314781 RepID=A0A165DW00_EXIGL|nr:hypothetical protein EXIGLDRAFT_726105 [Exidia glandulosa HHB12029]
MASTNTNDLHVSQPSSKESSTKSARTVTLADGTNTQRSPPRWHVSHSTKSKPKGEKGVIIASRLLYDGPTVTHHTRLDVQHVGTSTLENTAAGAQEKSAADAMKIVEAELAYIEGKARDGGDRPSMFPSLMELLASLAEAEN